MPGPDWTAVKSAEDVERVLRGRVVRVDVDAQSEHGDFILYYSDVKVVSVGCGARDVYTTTLREIQEAGS